MFDSQGFRDKMTALERRHEEVGALLGTPEVINKRAEFLKLSREHSELDPLVTAWKSYQKLRDNLAKAKQMADADPFPVRVLCGVEDHVSSVPIASQSLADE